MKKIFAAAFVLVLAGAATANAGVNFSVNLGVPAAVVGYPAPMVSDYPAPAPAVVGYPAPAQVVVSEAPRFIYSPDLGYYVSVGAPYQMVYVDNCYYRYRGGAWSLAATYGGPWSPVPGYRLPEPLRRHHFREVRYYRDREFRNFDRDRDHYRGTWFRPVADGRDERREWYRGEEHRWHGDHDRDGRWDRR